MAVWLIIAFLVIATAGQMVPRGGGAHSPGLYAKTVNALGLKGIYSSWTFIVLTGLLAVNVSICMGNRIRILFADRPGRSEDGIFWNRKQLPLLGSLLFHISFLVIIAGACYSAATRMEGRAYITEGETFTDRHDDYIALHEAPFFFEDHKHFKLRLDEVSMSIKQNVITEMTGRMTVFDGKDSFERTVRVNHPLAHKNTSFMINRHGFSPHFILEDENGVELFDSYVKLSSESGMSKDSFSIPESGLDVSAIFWPDADVIGGKIKPRSPEMKNPVLELTVNRKIGEGRLTQRLYKGFLEPGETAEFKNYRLTFADVRYWLRFDARKDRGQAVLFAGFWLGATGIALRFIAAHGLNPLAFLNEREAEK